MSNFIDRIQYFMKQTGINNNQMTVAAGLSVGLIGRAIKSKSSLNSDSIEKILYAYPNLNPNWLLTGRGEMLITNNQEEINGQVNGQENGQESDKSKDKEENKNGNLNGNPNGNQLDENPNKVEEFNDLSIPLQKGVAVKIHQEQLHMPDILSQPTEISVPFYNLPVSAGMLGMLESDFFSKNTPDGFLQLSAFAGCEAVFPVIGVSMDPIISSGDWIGIKSIDNISRSWDFIQTNVIYLIITREDRMIKFIDKATDDDFVVCRSVNASPFKVYKGDILKLYRVKACVKNL